MFHYIYYLAHIHMCVYIYVVILSLDYYLLYIYRIEVNYCSIFLGVTLDKHTYPETKGFPYRVCQPICGDQDELGDWELETMAMTVAILHLHPSTTYKLHTPGESICRLQVLNTLRSSSSSSLDLFRSWSSSCLWAWNVATHTHNSHGIFPWFSPATSSTTRPRPCPWLQKTPSCSRWWITCGRVWRGSPPYRSARRE